MWGLFGVGVDGGNCFFDQGVLVGFCQGILMFGIGVAMVDKFIVFGENVVSDLWAMFE